MYELLVRTWLCAHGKATGKGLHRATVALVLLLALCKAYLVDGSFNPFLYFRF